MAPCKCYKDGLGLYVDGDLDREKRLELEKHLAVCPDCAHQVDEIYRLRGMLKELPSIHATESFHFVLRDRIRRELAQQQRRSSFSYVLVHRLAPAMALGIVVLAGSFWILRQKTDLFRHEASSALASSNQAGADLSLDPSAYHNVRYVIDDYGDAVSLDRQDTPFQRHPVASDSLPNPYRSTFPGSRAAQVSF